MATTHGVVSGAPRGRRKPNRRRSTAKTASRPRGRRASQRLVRAALHLVLAAKPLVREVGSGVLRLWRSRLRRPLSQVGLLTLSYIVALNLLVRTVGRGAPALFSPLHVANKTRALTLLALHLPSHWVGSCGIDAKSFAIRAAHRQGLPPALVLSIVHAESGYHPHAISYTGAMGLMQLMPGTASDLGVPDPFAPRGNIDGATRLLGRLWGKYAGDVDRVVAAYHAGDGAVPLRGPMLIGPATRQYIRAVRSRMAAYASVQ